MFCHLYKFFERTGVPLSEYQSCEDECIECIDGNCSLVKKDQENLTDNKFSWMIDKLLVFKEPKESKSKNTSYISALCIVHPAHPDVWILYCVRNKKNKELVSVYRYYEGVECKEFDNIRALNSYFRKRGYEGRPLTSPDFMGEIKDKNVHN